MKVRRLSREHDWQPAALLLQRFFREEGFTTAVLTIVDNLRRFSYSLGFVDEGRLLMYRTL